MKSNLPRNISAKELEKIHKSLKVVQGGGKKKRMVYADKQEIAKYVAVCGATVIPIEVPTFNRKYRVPKGKKLQKIYTRTVEDGSIQCGTEDWES